MDSDATVLGSLLELWFQVTVRRVAVAGDDDDDDNADDDEDACIRCGGGMPPPSRASKASHNQHTRLGR